MKPQEVHKMNDEELRVETERLRKRLYELRCQAVTEKLENPMQIRRIKQDIARMQTEGRMRQIKTA
jgi:ribosomal protein L29